MSEILKKNLVVSQLPQAGPSNFLKLDRPELVEKYSIYFRDESKLEGGPASAIAFPKTWQEVSSLLADATSRKISCTISGSRTGVVGGAVCESQGELISLEKLKYLNPVLETVEVSGLVSFSVELGAGVTLRELNQFLSDERPELFFPVDPTEQGASFGGMLATNAAGARSYRFGSIRNWVNWIRVVLGDGTVLEIERGQYLLGESLQLKVGENLREITLLKEIAKPKTKNSLGYCWGPTVDLIDVFIGSEGTLGVITDIRIKLARCPEQCLYAVCFFGSEDQALKFVSDLDHAQTIHPFAIEFCDSSSLRFVEKSSIASSNRIAGAVKSNHLAAVYTEIPMTEDTMEEVISTLDQMFLSNGGVEQDCLAGCEDRDLREMKAFRHAIPETINATIARRKQEIPSLHKIATDMAVSKSNRSHIFNYYKSKLEAEELEFAIFGHAGDAHFHVNILPRTVEELSRAKQIYAEFAEEVVGLSGAVSAEHGLGTLKKQFLSKQYDSSIFQEMNRIRSFFDPGRVLSINVLC